MGVYSFFRDNILPKKKTPEELHLRRHEEVAKQLDEFERLKMQVKNMTHRMNFEYTKLSTEGYKQKQREFKRLQEKFDRLEQKIKQETDPELFGHHRDYGKAA
jgi:predicted nuclease with TOPRIM domain